MQTTERFTQPWAKAKAARIMFRNTDAYREHIVAFVVNEHGALIIDGMRDDEFERLVEMAHNQIWGMLQ